MPQEFMMHYFFYTTHKTLYFQPEKIVILALILCFAHSSPAFSLELDELDEVTMQVMDFDELNELSLQEVVRIPLPSKNKSIANSSRISTGNSAQTKPRPSTSPTSRAKPSTSGNR